MGQSTDQTVRAIDDTRDRLGEEIAELEGRVQQRAAASRRALIPVAGAVAAAGAAWLTVRTIRRRSKRTKRTLPVKVLGKVLPDRVTDSIAETLESDGWKLGLAAAGGIWVLVRMAELRQLRRLNRTLVVR